MQCENETSTTSEANNVEVKTGNGDITVEVATETGVDCTSAAKQTTECENITLSCKDESREATDQSNNISSANDGPTNNVEDTVKPIEETEQVVADTINNVERNGGECTTDHTSCDHSEEEPNLNAVESEKNIAGLVVDEIPAKLDTNNKPSDEADSNATQEQSLLIDNNTVKSKRSDSPKSSDEKALDENISSKTLELEESMDMDRTNSTSTSTIAEQLPTPNKICTETEKNQNAVSGLGLLAQYNSDSDADCNDDNDVVEVPIETNKDYRNKVVEIDSESESDTTSSDSDVEYLTTIRKEIEKTIDFNDDEDDDEDGESDGADGKKKRKRAQMRVKGEMLLEDLPPIQDLHITVPEEECIELGRVHSIVDQLLLVSVLPDSLLLDLDTVLFLDKGKKVLGEVFDVLGQVADPIYCVRFNSHKEIEEKNIKIGDTVYVAPKTKYTQFVILSNLMKLRGSDASWENDIEPPPRYVDYSDDEEEREARARFRNKDRPNDHEDSIKRSRTVADDSSSSSAIPSGSQNRFNQRKGRFNQERNGPLIRSPYQYSRSQVQPNAPYSGSWHSNYQHPYYPYHNPPPIHSPYPPYSPSPYLPPPPPQMSPMSSPVPPPLYVLNPMAALPPGMQNNRAQYHNPQPFTPLQRQSPPPEPPGLH